jgi:hypothetical protein
MAHHQVVVLQVVVTHPIAVLIQVVHQPHVEIHPVQAHDHRQIVPIVHPVHTEIVLNVVTIVVHLVTVQRVVPTEIVTRVQVPVRHLIAANAVTVRATRAQVPTVHHVHTVTDRNVAMIVDQALIVQQVVHMETATRAHHHDHLLIAANVVTAHATRVHLQIVANAVTVQEIHDHHQIVPIVHRAHTVTDQNVVTIVVQVLIAQLVAHTEIVTHVQAHVHLQIVHVEITHLVVIVQRQAMTDVHHAMIAAVHVTANAAVVQIVPEVALPMIAKSVHAVALAKSA